jgi:hypothetical protein
MNSDCWIGWREVDRVRELDNGNFVDDLLEPTVDRAPEADLPVSIVLRRTSELIAASRREASWRCSDVVSPARTRRLRRSLIFFV